MREAGTMRSVAVAVAGVAVSLLSLPQPAVAQEVTMTFNVQSHYRYQVQLAFYSQMRRGHEWPGSGRAYRLEDSEAHEFALQCIAGERICYGAWPTGDASVIWGVGTGRARCSDCCYICHEGETELIQLGN